MTDIYRLYLIQYHFRNGEATNHSNKGWQRCHLQENKS